MTSGSKIQRWSSRLLGKRGSLALMEKIAQLPIFTRQRGLVGMVGDYQDRRKTLSAALAQVDRILLPSPFMRPFFAGHGLPEEKMKVIQEGIDTGWFSGLIARIESDRLRIAYLGQVRPAKGVHLLIEAAQGLRGNYRVRVYGNMRQDPAYAARLVDAAGKNSNIEFPGGYTRAQLEPILMDTDIVVLPSISMEPFGIIAREALFAGVPVVASNTGGLVDVVQPGINGALCPPGDMTALKKILQALVDDPRRLVNLRQPSGKIRGMAEEVDELEQEYQAILAGQKPEKHKHLEGCR
ncbi:MAG: glycosyltransferase [Chloroflexi bacterium]|nr:MAG: glycosyltransferase [Chloroflexota bacterium]